MRLTTTPGSPRSPIVADRVSGRTASVALAVTLLLIFLLDRTTESAPVQHLYYIPIVFGAIRFGNRGAMALAAIAIVLYHAANPRLFSFRYAEEDLIPIILFIAVGAVAARLASNSRRLHLLAMTDDLTGLHNLRSFEARFMEMIRSSRETNSAISILMLDVDKLKSLNDAYGHLVGAEAVRTVGHLVAVRLAEHDIACRYGGDEFVIAMPNCLVTRAAEWGRALCVAVHESAPVLADRQFPKGSLSISVGVAWNPGIGKYRETSLNNEDWGQALFHAADSALYAAKEAGRNRVRVDDQPVTGSPPSEHTA